MALQLRALRPPCSIIHVEDGDKGCAKSLGPVPVCEVTIPILEWANIIFTLPFATNTFEKPLFTAPAAPAPTELRLHKLPPSSRHMEPERGFGKGEAAGGCWEAQTSEELSDSWRAQGLWLAPCWLCSMVERVWYACCRFRWFLRSERPPPACSSLCQGKTGTHQGATHQSHTEKVPGYSG